MRKHTLVALLIAGAVAVVPSAAGATVAGDVFAFGNNAAGQLGLNSTDQYPTPVAAPIDATNLGGRKIVQASAGNFHNLLLADDGIAFSFGANGSGQGGLGTTSSKTLLAMPIDTTNLGSRKITQVSAGDLNSLLLADDGTVFSFGSNADGRTGLGTTTGFTPLPTPIDATNLGGRKIIQVEAGKLHSLLVADDGTVFSFGSNTYGQTGLGTTTGVTPVATPIVGTNLGGRKITHVTTTSGTSAGHNLLLADDGTVFSFGSNFYGQLGLGTHHDSTGVSVAMPIDASNLGGRKITQIAAGVLHSLLLADDGSVFSFGHDGNGQTGLGTYGVFNAVATPILTTNLGSHKVTQISAGDSHSLILTDDGRVFAFGSNSAYQCGFSMFNAGVNIATPIDTTNLSGLAVTQVAGGGQHSLLIAVLPGDFNQDGTVDAADYVVLRKDPGGVYTPDDYTIWRADFGQPVGSGSGANANTSIPEPTTMMQAILTAAVASLRRRRDTRLVPKVVDA